MEAFFHRFTELFDQLGLPSDPFSIAAFLREKAPLAPDMPLAEAPFWTASQAELLRQLLADDADWAEVIDRLSLALRG